jgi:ABC-type nitrate/sulfonate/bicarbonate transport system substrate-binding protein
MNRTVIVFAAAAVITAVVVIAMIYSNIRIPKITEIRHPDGPVEKLVITFVEHPFAAPIAVAHTMGFFTDEGLEITLLPHAAGIPVIDALITGQAGLASAAETEVVGALMEGHSLKLAAVISTSEMALSIIGLKERGIHAREDLKGKKIGITPGTPAEFNLRVLLSLSGIPLSEVRLIELMPEEIDRAISTGIVDAVSTWEPYTTQLFEKFGPDAVQFYNTPPITVSHSILVHRKLIDNNPDVIEKALRALIRAEDFIRNSPGESCIATAAVIGMDKRILCRIWNDYTHEIKLDQNLIVRLEVLARWLEKKVAFETDGLHNFLDYIYVDGLMSADPGKVTLVHRGIL